MSIISIIFVVIAVVIIRSIAWIIVLVIVITVVIIALLLVSLLLTQSVKREGLDSEQQGLLVSAPPQYAAVSPESSHDDTGTIPSSMCPWNVICHAR